MKTNQIVTRKMGDFNVYQQTKDAYFDASALLHQWNMNRKTKKKIDEFLRIKPTKEFIDELGNELRINDSDYNRHQEPTLIYTIKGRTLKGKGSTPDKVWMHPYLFTKFAMWLDPKFELDVIKTVYDNLNKMEGTNNED